MKTAMVLIALAGCTSLRGKADAAYAHGDYAKAADLYDQLVRGGDTGAIPRRTQAREEELRVELYNVQAARAAGYELTGKLALLLDQRDEWEGDGAAPLAGGIAFEVAAASSKIGAQVAARTDKDGPLAGEDVASHYEKLLGHADFASARTAIQTRLAEIGRARCTRVETASATPYWRWLTARYCGHWSQTRAVPILPDHYRGLVVDGTIAGETTGEISALSGALQTAFARSAWYAPTGSGAVHANIAGTLAVTYSSQQVTLTASWTEQVPYTDYETQQESYQEPYDDTETYTEEEPSTEYVPCGDTTCPQTVYHTETKTRTVTKYRTAYRDVTVPVTRYRDEPRTEDYNAIERTGSYASALSVQLGAIAAASVETSTSESGYDHDVTIEPAGVSPSRANLTSHEQFAAHEAATLADRFVEQLDAAYAQQFCGLATFTLEQAARCAYAGAQHVPPAAQRALGRVFGGEAPYLVRITGGSDDHAVATNR